MRTLIADDFRDVFDDGVDVLFTPTTPTPAFELGAKSDPYEMYLSDIFTATANLAGVPAMSHADRPRRRPAGRRAAHRAALRRGDRCSRAAFALERALGEEAHR